MRNRICKKVLILCMAGLLLFGNSVQVFAFTTSCEEEYPGADNGVTPQNRHIFNQLKDIIVPNVVDKVLETFPAFSYLKNSDIQIGFAMSSDEGWAAAAMDAVPLFGLSEAAQANVKQVNFSLRINSSAREITWNSSQNDFEYRDELEQLIAHEVMHAFLSEGMRSGMYGYNPVEKKFDTSEAIPIWFSEGVPQAIAGDRGFANNTDMNGINANSSNEDIKYALEQLQAGTVGAYGTGYIASMYFAYWAGNTDKANISGYKADGITLAKGLNIFMQEIISGQSFDETIEEYTNYTGLPDFEARFKDDVNAYDFVRALFTERGNNSPKGALLTKDLKAQDILADVRTEPISSLFKIHDTFKGTIVTYPRDVNVMSGGSRNRQGFKPVSDYEGIPSLPNIQKLPTPENLKLEKIGDKLAASWDLVPNASEYEVVCYLGNNMIDNPAVQTETTFEMDFPAAPGKYSVSVKAISHDSNFQSSDIAKTQDYIFSAKPTLIQAGPTTIEIKRDFNHEYQISGSTDWVSTETSQGSGKLLFTGLIPDTEYTITARIKATTAASEPLTVHTAAPPKRDTPTDLKWEKKADNKLYATWNANAFNGPFDLLIYKDGSLFSSCQSITDTKEYEVDILQKTGEYYFTVMSLGDKINFSNSDVATSGNTTVLTVPVEKLVTSSSITVFEESNQEYSIDNGTSWQDSGTFINLLENTEYEIVTRVKTRPDELASVKITTLNTEDMVVLHAPQNLSWEKTEGSLAAKWDAVDNAIGYEVKMFCDDIEVSSQTVTETTEYMDSLSEETKSYKFTVKALGDDVTYTSSAESVSEVYQVVQKPSIKDFDASTIWVIPVAGQEYAIQGMDNWNETGEFTELLPNTAYQIVTRLKNKPNAVSEPLSVTTKTLILEAPKNVTLVKVNHKLLVTWDRVKNAIGYEVTLYSGETIVDGPYQAGGKFRSTVMSYEMDLPRETGQYSCRVLALGDGVNSFPSVSENSEFLAFVSKPSISRVGENELEIEAKPNHEYSIDNGVTWQQTGLFTGLKAGTTYTIISRVVNTTDISEELVVKTNGKEVTEPGEDKPGEDKPDEDKPDVNKPDENKPDANKPDANKPDENKPDANKPDENKSNENKTDENKFGENPAENRPKKTGVNTSDSSNLDWYVVMLGSSSVTFIGYMMLKKRKEE